MRGEALTTHNLLMLNLFDELLQGHLASRDPAPKELLDETGRSSVTVLFALKDKNQREFFLGFTHEELIDRDYIDRYTLGFEQLAQRAAEYPPERVAQITGLNVADIVGLARDYGTIKPAVIRWPEPSGLARTLRNSFSKFSLPNKKASGARISSLS